MCNIKLYSICFHWMCTMGAKWSQYIILKKRWAKIFHRWFWIFSILTILFVKRSVKLVEAEWCKEHLRSSILKKPSSIFFKESFRLHWIPLLQYSHRHQLKCDAYTPSIYDKTAKFNVSLASSPSRHRILYQCENRRSYCNVVCGIFTYLICKVCNIPF